MRLTFWRKLTAMILPTYQQNGNQLILKIQQVSIKFDHDFLTCLHRTSDRMDFGNSLALSEWRRYVAFIFFVIFVLFGASLILGWE